MRNLKKILALVLALVMSMSLVVTANAFTDDESINETYLEAAEVLAGLKVLQGRPDGSFDPKANVNRGEMAAIIYRMVTTDVEDLQTSIYAESSKLSDVPGTWSAGYVGFCNNSNLILGYPDNTFQQNKTVTGHEALAMLLRAIGYGKNGEFVGKDWAINTAIYAKMNGLLKNINESTLSQPATREMVAEMAFRALSAEKVNWSLGLNYQKTGETLGDAFNLKEFEGVITANQYADIYGAYGVGENETVLNDETSYEWATDLPQIGMNYRGWSCGKKNTVIFNEVTGNTTFETGAATTITPSKIDGIRLNDETEYLRNFDGDDNWTSDYRLEYVLDLEFDLKIGDATTDNYKTVEKAVNYLIKFFGDLGLPIDETDLTISGDQTKVTFDHKFTEEIAPGEKISKYDVAIMKYIFSYADKEEAVKLGEVYYGTKSVVGTDDISDEISWKEFDNKYLNDPSNFAEIEATGNGDWLKVIDNDGDGYADYVFVTEFTMEQVVDLSKKNVLTLTGPENDDGEFITVFGSATTEPFVTADELAKDDIVLYAVIDGVAYVDLAPSFTGEVDKYQYKTDVLVIDDVEYTESDIDEHTNYQNELEKARKETEYTYYQDHFDFIRIFALPKNEAAGLTLLTDAYFETKRAENDYAVKAFLDGEIKDPDVVNNAAGFIDDQVDYNGWGKLVDFDEYNALNVKGHGYGRYTEDAFSNLAFYSMNEDGELVLGSGKTYALNKKGEKVGIKTDYIDLDEKDLAAGQNRYTGKYAFADEDLKADNVTPLYGIADTGSVTVETNAKTVFYYVYKDARGTAHVKSVTGFKNALPVVDDISTILSIYAVATNVNADSEAENYWLANAIVVETEFPVFGSANDVVLGYEMDNKTYKDFGGMDAILGTGKLDTLNIVSVNGEDDIDDVDYDTIDADGTIVTPFFYTNTLVTEENDSFINAIEKDFGKYGIYAAKVDREVAIGDYIVTTESTATPGSLFVTADTQVYDLEWNSSAKSYVKAERVDLRGNDYVLKTNEHYIFYANAKNEIIYAVLVDDNASNVVTSTSDDILNDLYWKIWSDGNVSDALSATIQIKGVDANAKAGETVTVTLSDTQAAASYAKEDWELFTTATGASLEVLNGTTGQTENSTVTGWKGATGLINDGDVFRFYLTKGSETVTYTVKVEVATAQNDVTLNSIIVKGKVATNVSTATDVGSSTNPYKYEVTLTAAEARDTTKVQLALPRPAEENSTIGAFTWGTAALTGWAMTNVNVDQTPTTATKAALTPGESDTLKFTVIPESGTGTYDKYYEVTININDIAEATFAKAAGAYTNTQVTVDPDDATKYTVVVPVGVTLDDDTDFNARVDTTLPIGAQKTVTKTGANTFSVLVEDDGSDTFQESTTYTFTWVAETVTAIFKATPTVGADTKFVYNDSAKRYEIILDSSDVAADVAPVDEIKNTDFAAEASEGGTYGTITVAITHNGTAMSAGDKILRGQVTENDKIVVTVTMTDADGNSASTAFDVYLIVGSIA